MDFALDEIIYLPLYSLTSIVSDVFLMNLKPAFSAPCIREISSGEIDLINAILPDKLFVVYRFQYKHYDKQNK